jgi:thiopeptide-type bacteriocin biosynthesis protein
LRQHRHLPRIVELVDGDNELPVDLDNPLGVETFIHLLRKRQNAVLTEMFPQPDRTVCRGPDGQYAHEAIVLLDTSAVPPPGRTATPPALVVPPTFRRRPPASDWLYFKIYCGTATADRVLRELAPAIREAMTLAGAERWFFIRYRDPDWHVRLRFHGEPQTLAGGVLPALGRELEQMLTRGTVASYQLDIYDREVTRYGGCEAVLLCERIFHADSEAVLSMLETTGGALDADARQHLVLLGVDRLLADFGCDIQERLAFLEGRRPAARHKQARRELGDLYRTSRQRIEAMLGERVGELTPVFEALRARSGAIHPVAAALRRLDTRGQLASPLTQILASLTHMHVNRVLRQSSARQEQGLYDFLFRFHESQLARAKRGAASLGDQVAATA